MFVDQGKLLMYMVGIFIQLYCILQYNYWLCHRVKEAWLMIQIK